MPLTHKIALCVLVWLGSSAVSAAWADDGGLAACLLKPKQTIQLGSPVFGVLAQVFVDRSAPVKAGEIVAKLDTSVEEAQVALDRFRAANKTEIEMAQTDLSWNQRELRRLRNLAADRLAKASEVDQYEAKVAQDLIAIRKATADQKTAALEAERSERQLQLKLIKSPINGIVTDVKLSPGDYIYENTPIMTIDQLDPLYIDLVLPAQRYGSVKMGQVAEVHLAAPIGSVVPATVDAVDAVVDPASDTFRVRLVMHNPGNRIPAGIRCSASLPTITAGSG